MPTGRSGLTFPGSGTTPSAADTEAALANATKGCAQVSTYDDVVTLPGYGSMSPTRAYALRPTVPDSAPLSRVRSVSSTPVGPPPLAYNCRFRPGI